MLALAATAGCASSSVDAALGLTLPSSGNLTGETAGAARGAIFTSDPFDQELASTNLRASQRHNASIMVALEIGVVGTPRHTATIQDIMSTMQNGRITG
jgi:hypothetical protein